MNRWLFILSFPFVVDFSTTTGRYEVVQRNPIDSYIFVCRDYSIGWCEDQAEALNMARERRIKRGNYDEETEFK